MHSIVLQIISIQTIVYILVRENPMTNGSSKSHGTPKNPKTTEQKGKDTKAQGK